MAKHLMLEAGIPTPPFFAFNETAFRELGAADALPAIEERLEFPIVVKPSSQGSALGIKFARSAEDVPAALVAAFSYDSKVLLERYVEGRDLAVSILDGEALPIVEAVPRDEAFYDFEARYEIGRTDFVCPADLPTEVAGRGPGARAATYQLLGCRGFARVDLMLGADGEPTVLEANPIPGLTETSLLPQAAEAAGISFDALVARILELARAPAGAAWRAAGSAGCTRYSSLAKSSGVTLSRKSLNFSTTSSVSSTSCSNSIADSEITSSAAKIGAPVRTASASASEGRESIGISRPFSWSVTSA